MKLPCECVFGLHITQASAHIGRLEAGEHIADIYDGGRLCRSEDRPSPRQVISQRQLKYSAAAPSHNYLPTVPRSHYSEESCINMSALCHQILN